MMKIDKNLEIGAISYLIEAARETARQDRNSFLLIEVQKADKEMITNRMRYQKLFDMAQTLIDLREVEYYQKLEKHLGKKRKKSFLVKVWLALGKHINPYKFLLEDE